MDIPQGLTRFDHIQIAVSRLLAAIVFAESQWMLSSLAYSRNAVLLRVSIDTLFWLLFKKSCHCQENYKWELEFNDRSNQANK